ncbi:hypothetical protein ACFSJW_01405 [Flavobacterium artemisiae]|uniref:Uncharacterized protein n=1 Tax=Flavobacterium artemisiae TaxID=2126556 RepID=A0ABW4HID5_9FLAO
MLDSNLASLYQVETKKTQQNRKKEYRKVSCML